VRYDSLLKIETFESRQFSQQKRACDEIEFASAIEFVRSGVRVIFR